MKFETFRGPSTAVVLGAARAALGEDVIIVRTGKYKQGTLEGVEVTATDGAQLDALMARLDPNMPAIGEPGTRAARGLRPYVLALVGPPGAGKTTTATKLAIHPRVFGNYRVGLLTLDTFRAGAINQLGAYTDVLELPMEVVYEPSDVPGAMARLAGCDVVIIDTPGRSPLSVEQNMRWRALLSAIQPDEIHLVIPASLRADVALAAAASFAPYGATHMIISKLDECPTGAGALDLVSAVDLRARWIATGQDVPWDLKPADPGLPAVLGRSA